MARSGNLIAPLASLTKMYNTTTALSNPSIATGASELRLKYTPTQFPSPSIVSGQASFTALYEYITPVCIAEKITKICFRTEKLCAKYKPVAAVTANEMASTMVYRLRFVQVVDINIQVVKATNSAMGPRNISRDKPRRDSIMSAGICTAIKVACTVGAIGTLVYSSAVRHSRNTGP
jgi:hypothetical protein